MECDEARPLLDRLADECEPRSIELQRHLRACSRCRADAASVRSLHRTLGGLRSVRIDPGPQLLAEVLSSVEALGAAWAENGVEDPRRMARRGAAVAAALGAAAAGACAAAIAVRRAWPTAGARSLGAFGAL